MRISLIPFILAVTTSFLQAQEKPDAAKLVREVRHGQAAQSFEMNGKLVKGRDTTKFTMKTEAAIGLIKFRFSDPIQHISLELKNNRYVLTEQLANKPPKELDQKRYGEKIRGTDVTYEDLSQRFLYWPNPKIVDDKKERISIGVRLDAWVVQLNNPRKLGPYSVVQIWIDKKSKALLRVDGYDWGSGPGSKARKIKRFEVTKAGKDKGVTMRITTIDQKGKEKEHTVMKMEKPK